MDAGPASVAGAAGPGQAAHDRLVTRVLGGLVILTAPAWGHGAVDQASAMAPWWVVLSAVGVGGPAAWLLVAAGRASTVRPPAVALAAGLAVALLGWPFAVEDVAEARSRLPWLWLILPVALSGLASLGSWRLSAAYGLGVGSWYGALRLLDSGGAATVPKAALEAVLIVALATGLCMLVLASLDSARRLDELAARTAAASAEASRAAARERTRAELDAIVHDTVLAVLHAAGRGPGTPGVAASAQQALASLRAAADDHGPEDVVDLGGLVTRLRPALAAVHPDARLVVDVTGRGAREGTAEGATEGATEALSRPDRDGENGLAGRVPARVGRSLVDATLEAVRNARRHAGERAATTVTVAAVPGGVSIRVTDTGTGFDPQAVDPARLGIAVSVRERVSRVGGTAVVDSVPGRGTTVSLAWRGEDRERGGPGAAWPPLRVDGDAGADTGGDAGTDLDAGAGVDGGGGNVPDTSAPPGTPS